MLAWTGWVAVDMGLRVYPVPEGFESLTSATAHDAAVAQGGLGQIFGWIAVAEMASWLGVAQMLQGSGREPGDFGLDPLRISDYVPMDYLREAELKHGRAAMLATVGFVVPEFVRIPGEQFSFESIPNVIDAHDALANTSMIQIFGWISFVEACTFPALANMNNYDRAPVTTDSILWDLSHNRRRSSRNTNSLN